MRNAQIWRYFYKGGAIVDVRSRRRPKSPPYLHPEAKEVERVEQVEEPTAVTIGEAWETITREVASYARQMGYTHRSVTSIPAKYAAVYELSRSWTYAQSCDSTLQKLRYLFLQGWLHYGSDIGYSSLIPHVSVIAVLLQDALHAQLRETKQEILDRISTLASSESSAVCDVATWVLFALDQAHPMYGRQHIVDVCIVQLMQALRGAEQIEEDTPLAGILTELWDALFQGEQDEAVSALR